MIHIDTTRTLGPIKPVNGMGNGPVSRGYFNSTKYYKKAGFPFVRMHDMNFPNPREVDVPQIFPDFDADADDPESYDFVRTDLYLRQIRDAGCDIIYRLGTSIENGELRFYVHPPKDFEKFAKVCLNIIRHYNHGWANGFHWDIKYWELWNEPDIGEKDSDRSRDGMWTGTVAQFYDFYAVVSKYIKAREPDILFGGYASCAVTEPSRVVFFEGFLARVKAEQLPLDFFSWHCYGDQPEKVIRRANFVRQHLDDIGYTHALSICDEWNYMLESDNIWPDLGGPRAEFVNEDLFRQAMGPVGATFTAAYLIAMQNSPVDIAAAFTGDCSNIFCTIFNAYGVPQKPFDAFLAFNEIRKMGNQVEATVTERGVYALASAKDNEICALIAQYTGLNVNYEISVDGLVEGAEYRLEKILTDATRNSETVFTQVGKPSELAFKTYMQAASFMLIKLTKI